MAPTGHVLVLGDNDRAGLTTVRSLGRAGLHVHLVAFEPSFVTRRSRYVHRVYRLGNPADEPQAFADRVIDLVRRRRFDLAVPTSDKALLPLMAHRQELEAHTRFAAPDQTGFEATYFKHITVAIARRIGIPVPQTQVLRDLDDLHSSRFERFPLVLKPTCSVTLGVAGKNEVRVVRSQEELTQRLPRMLARGPVLVQEFCKGHGVGINVLADRGEVVAAFQHRRVHEPVGGGASSYRVSVPLSADLLDAARRFCRELAWTGPTMLEFKQDSATGTAILMEVNGRLWGSLALAVQAGVDFPRLMYDLYVHGRTTPTFDYRVPFFVRHTTADADWFGSIVRSSAGREALRRTNFSAEIQNALGFREGFDLEALDDPLPAVVAWLEFLRDKAGKVANKFADWWWAQRAMRQFRDRQAFDQALATARSVLFICHGNINRSAFAEKKLQAILGNRVRIASAGFLPDAGRTPGPTSRAVADQLGVSLADHRSVVLTANLLEKFDLILYMEPAHLRAIRAMGSRFVAKCFPLSVLDCQGGPLDIPDPDGRDETVFTAVFGRIGTCVTELADRLDRKAA